MERITSAQPPPCLSKHPPLDLSDMSGMDFPMYVYKPRRGMKRGDDSKDTYKLPHRLIEKKRRDRINECIAQLKDLLPEHLKLTTLGHLEKAVVLELTLKHVKALNTLLEQQQQQIISLQNGMQIGDHGVASSETSEEMFRSGFHLCAKEVLQYLASQENPQELTASHVVNHLHKVASDLLQRPASPCLDPPSPVSAPVSTRRGLDSREKTAPASGSSGSGPAPPRTPEGHAKNCVPVIQRTYPHSSEQSGSDTDTDSGYGGEVDKRESVKAQRGIASGNGGYYGGAKDGVATRPGGIKEERDEPPLAKRPRSDSSEDESLSGHEGSVGNGHGAYVSFSPHQPPLCMPFYLIPPSAAYLPMLEKCWYPGMPMLYPGLGGGGGGAPAAVLPHDKLAVSPRAASPATASIVPPTPMDSPALLQALKQVPPLNLETKD